MVDEITFGGREEQAWTLRGELKEIGTLAKRTSYVHRITELVKNSQKQEKDIAKIITDTRELQRESNSANDRLRRTYALVDELVFRSLFSSSSFEIECWNLLITLEVSAKTLKEGVWSLSERLLY